MSQRSATPLPKDIQALFGGATCQHCRHYESCRSLYNIKANDEPCIKFVIHRQVMNIAMRRANQ